MRLRPYEKPKDDNHIARVRDAARAVDGDVWLPGPDTDDGPAQACRLAEADGTVVGFTWLTRWIEDDGTEVFLLSGVVDPAHRGRGYGTAMLRHQQAYASSLDSTMERTVLAANADDTQPDVRELLLRNGFRVAFTVVRMRCPVSEAAAPADLPFQIRPVLPEHHPALHAAIVECFTGGYGTEPLDYDDYLAGVRDTDLWVVAWDGAEIAGLVTNEREADGTVDSPWVAVRPQYRRRGLASALLRRSLATMRANGITVATLRTVAENENDSVGLYEKAGYRVTQRLPRYRKARLTLPPV
jgi:ribosomal protein S18 acetylase RimI-like enzyme